MVSLQNEISYVLLNFEVEKTTLNIAYKQMVYLQNEFSYVSLGYSM